MRLDVYLKQSRLIKRRSVAKESCDSGRVRVGGASSKPGREVKPGDVISLRFPRRRLVVEVVETPTGNVTKERATTLYRVVEDTKQEEEF